MEREAQIVAKELAEGYREVLKKYKKVATGRTIRSIEPGHRITETGFVAYVEANIGLFYIQSGRRKGAKLPMEKRGGSWYLKPRLELWKQAVNFGGPDFLLARAISRKGIKGIDITGEVIELKLESILDTMSLAVEDDMAESIVNIYRNGLTL